MPSVNIYLDKESYQAYKKLKSLLAKINQARGTRLSVSFLISLYIRKLVEQLEKSDLTSITNVKIDLPTINININKIELEEKPRFHGQTKITTIILAEQYKEWIKRFKQSKRILNSETKQRVLTNLKYNILSELRKYKQIPENLLNDICSLLAEIDQEIDRSIDRGFL